MAWLANQTLLHPWIVAFVCLLMGLGSGGIFEVLFDANHFQRAGNLTLLLGLVTFGATVGELIIHGQAGLLADKNGELPYPHNRKNLESVFLSETTVIAVGVLQSGYGDFLMKALPV